jgi:hypothetical protein
MDFNIEIPDLKLLYGHPSLDDDLMRLEIHEKHYFF